MQYVYTVLANPTKLQGFVFQNKHPALYRSVQFATYDLIVTCAPPFFHFPFYSGSNPRRTVTSVLSCCSSMPARCVWGGVVVIIGLESIVHRRKIKSTRGGHLRPQTGVL